MILHCVFCHFRGDATAAQRAEILHELSVFAKGLPGVLAFEFGPNRDFERKSPAYGEGFVVRFQDRAALEHYAVHPSHQALGQRLCGLCEGGGDGIIVFDLDVSKAV